MPDVFISYSQAEAHYTHALASALQEKGYAVWWDAGIAPGQSIHTIVEEQLGKAKASIVIWTPSSIKSDWVKAEAEYARLRGKLITVRTPELDPRSIPLPFNAVNCVLVDDYRSIQRALAKLGVPRSTLSPETADHDGHVMVVTRTVEHPIAWGAGLVALAFAGILLALIVRPDLFLGAEQKIVPAVSSSSRIDGIEQVKKMMAQEQGYDWSRVQAILNGLIAIDRVDAELYLARLYLDGKAPADWEPLKRRLSWGHFGVTSDVKARQLLENTLKRPQADTRQIGEAKALLARALDKPVNGKADAGQAARMLLEAASSGDDFARKELDTDMSNWTPATRIAIKWTLRDLKLYDGAEDHDWNDATRSAIRRYVSRSNSSSTRSR